MAALTGSCLCGGVTFEVTEPFQRISACHCESCKKISGGGGTVSGRALTNSIRILGGEDLLRTYQPGEGTSKTFCSRCGTNLFGGGWPEHETASVRLSALDEPYEGSVGHHIYVRSLAPWELLPDDGAERHETRAP
jgi:hypothetical protein